jgi:hypothetical protein
MKSLLIPGTALTTLNLRKLAFTLLFCAVLLVIAAPAQVILQENFDELTPQLTVTSAGTFFNTINPTNVDIVGGDLFGYLCVPPESGNCLDLDGSDGLSQGDLVSTTFTLNPGILYTLSFDLIGSQRDVTTSTTVSLGSYYSQTFVLDSGDITSGIVTTQFTVPSTTTNNYLEFKSNTPGNVGALLDNVSITAPSQNTLTVTLLDSGSGTVTDNSTPSPLINCSEASGVVTGTCSANYTNGTMVTLTAAATPPSTFGGWGGACAESGMNTTCTVTMNNTQNVTASFVIPGQTQSGNINPEPTQPTVFSYGGGFKEGSPTSGFDYTAEETDTGLTLLMTVTAIPQLNQQACNALVQANPSFSTAECFVIQNGGGLGVDAPVLFEVTCPPNGSCGSNSNPFDAILGSDFNFNCSENAPLLCGPPPYFPSSFGPPNLTSIDGLPAIGFLKGTGPDENHPCTPYPGNFPPLFQSNQIVSFTVGDTSSKPIKGQSAGSTSCWLATYLTPGELPTVAVTQPVNNNNYQQNLSDATTLANYTCTAVNNGNAATGPYLTVASCSATDNPGGPVASGSHFDTSTTGPHTFTANVEDSALNTAASTVLYNVLGPPAVKSANYATFMEGTPGSFTVTTSGYPYPVISYSPFGSLPAGVSLVDNHNGTATLSGTPTVSGVFTFWITASYGSSHTVQSFTLTVTAPLTVTPTSLAFGSVTVNQTAKKSVTVQNNSGKSVGIGPVTFTVTMGAKSQFTLGQACPATLPAGNSCTIGVNFTPNAKGGDAATLNIVTTAPGSPLKVPITAAGK